MTILAANDWLDYAQAFGGIASVIIAVAALILAIKSATDSARSATAAEDTAKAAQEEAALTRELVAQSKTQVKIELEEYAHREADRRRRPLLGVELGISKQLVLPTAVIRARIENRGDKDAENVLVTFLAPNTIQFVQSGPDGGKGAPNSPSERNDIRLASAGEPVTAVCHSWRIGTVPAHQWEDWHAVVYFRASGSFELELRADHPDCELAICRYRFDVPAEGPITAERVRLGGDSG